MFLFIGSDAVTSSIDHSTSIYFLIERNYKWISPYVDMNYIE